VIQTAKNLVLDLQDAGCQVSFLIRDRDFKYPALIDAILADNGIEVVLSGVRLPRMNSMIERWIQSCRRELLDRTLIWNQAHLLWALREYERHYNKHRRHCCIEPSPDNRITQRRPLEELAGGVLVAAGRHVRR
jgi:transposase InsO family protein